MTGAELVAVGDPDGENPIALVELKVNPVHGIAVMDQVGAAPGRRYDILLTNCQIGFAGMHLNRNQVGESYIGVVAKVNGVAVIPRD